MLPRACACISCLQINGYHQGIWMAWGAGWEYDAASNLSIHDVDHNGLRVPPETQWRRKRIALRGSHPGCIERRDRKRMIWLMPNTCEFDGRLSLVSALNGSLLLYARANMAGHGQRFVQVGSPAVHSCSLQKSAPHHLSLHTRLLRSAGAVANRPSALTGDAL